MTNIEFKAFVVSEDENRYIGRVVKRRISDLLEGELLVKVHYSSLNYKDALSATGNRGVTRNYPHTPGIDAVGVVVQSKCSNFQVDDKVIVTSYDLGMNTSGGFCEYISVPSSWALKLPENLTMIESMIYGTAGLTAGISVLRLIELVKPTDGDVIVSGATGGVGSLSVGILSKLGYSVIAITGKKEEKDFLLELGAKEVLLREDFEKLDNKPLLRPQYAGAIDSVGGVILENIIKSTNPNGAVTCCGNVASVKLELTVFPFILRGITLIGVDSQNYPMPLRERVWEELATNFKPVTLDNNYKVISLYDLEEKVSLILQGKLKGRTIVKII